MIDGFSIIGVNGKSLILSNMNVQINVEIVQSVIAIKLEIVEFL